MSETVVNYDGAMGRWEPNARGRLEQAALDLFEERGFDQTTVAAIAERAGLTERTFFRHFADKREVLFGVAEPLRAAITDAVAALPAAAPPIEAAAAAVLTVSAGLQDRREHARRRQALIAGNRELQERDLIKMANLAAMLTDALLARGVPDLQARLAAETAIAVFKIAFERWLEGSAPRELAPLLVEAFAEFRVVAAGLG
jgi:AcrR family transcriptional regulator